MIRHCVIAFVLFLVVLSGSSKAAYYEADMSGAVNYPFKWGVNPLMYPTANVPSGQVTLGGVPFYLIPRGGKQSCYSGFGGSVGGFIQDCPPVAGALLTGVTVVISFFGHKRFSFRSGEKALD